MQHSNLAVVFAVIIFGLVITTSANEAECAIRVNSRQDCFSPGDSRDEFVCTMLKRCCWDVLDKTCYKKAGSQPPPKYQPPAPQPQQQFGGSPSGYQPPPPPYPPQQQPYGQNQYQPQGPAFSPTTAPPYQTPYPGAPNPFQVQQTQPPPYGRCNEIVMKDANTFKTCNGNFHGSVCKFSCRAGWRKYLGTGDDTVTCQTNGQWSGKPVSCTNPPPNSANPGLPFPMPQQQQRPNSQFGSQYRPPYNQQNNFGNQQPNYGSQQPNYGQPRAPSQNINNLIETLDIQRPQQSSYPPTNNVNAGGGALGTNVPAPTLGKPLDGQKQLAGLGTMCEIANSVKDEKSRLEWIRKYGCTGNERKIDESKAGEYVENLFGGLITPGKEVIPQNNGPVGSRTPQYNNQQVIPKHAPSSFMGQQQNQAMCKLLKGAKLGDSKYSTMLAAQYGCPMTSSGNPLLTLLSGGVPPLESLLQLFGGPAKKDPEYKKGPILWELLSYETLSKCKEKQHTYPSCRYDVHKNINNQYECLNIGCIYDQNTKKCFRCSLVPASAYLLQQTSKTCDLISVDERVECPGFQKYQLTTIMFAAQNPPASSSSSSPDDIASLLGGKGLGGLSGLFGGSSGGSSTNSALAGLLGGSGSLGGLGGLAGLGGGGTDISQLMGLLQRSSSGSSPTTPPTTPAPTYKYSDVVQRVAGSSPEVRSGLDISTLMSLVGGGGAGGLGGLGGLASLMGGGGSSNTNALLSLMGGGGGASGLAGLLGGAGGAGAGAFGGMNPKLIQALLSKNDKPESSSDLIALLYGGSAIDSKTKKVLADACEKKQCCWKSGGSLGGTCYSKGNKFRKNCIPKFDSGECGKSPSNIFQRIVGGYDIESDTHRPWTAIIKAAGSNTLRCGGTLICSQWILTAASCLVQKDSIESDGLRVPNLDPQSINVWIGTKDPADPGLRGTQVVVNRIIPHNQFAGFPYNDIALIRIKQLTMTGQKAPACLPELTDTKSPIVGNVLRFAGFGDAGDGSPQSELKEIAMTVKSSSTCLNDYGAGVPSAGVFCASTATGTDSDTCTGDGGSGAMRYDADNDVFKLVGINIAGSDRCSGAKSSLFTKVSTYMSWIAETTGGCCEQFSGRVGF